MVLALLERAADFVAHTSALLQRTSTELRSEVAAFEREAAIAQTAPAMSRTETQALKSTATATELMQKVNLTHQGERFRLEFRGNAGGGAEGSVSQAELQRILDMLKSEVVKAGWSAALAEPSQAAPTTESASKPIRH